MIDNSTSAIGGERKFEGRATRAIEARTSRAPSTFYLGLAIASMVGSAAIMATDLSRTRPRFGRGSRSGLANSWGNGLPRSWSSASTTKSSNSSASSSTRPERRVAPSQLIEEGRARPSRRARFFALMGGVPGSRA